VAVGGQKMTTSDITRMLREMSKKGHLSLYERLVCKEAAAKIKILEKMLNEKGVNLCENIKE
jgi:hypothetical protein